MKFETEAAPILDAATFVGKAADRKVTIPICAMIRIKPDAGALTLAATNMQVWASARIRGEAEPGDGVCVDADMLRRFLAALPKGSRVTGEADGKRLRLKAARAKADLPTLPGGDMPPEPAGALTGATLREVPAGFADMLASVALAASRDEQRQYLTGICIEPEAIVASDGHRLHHIALPGMSDEPHLFPAERVALLSGMMDNDGRFAITRNAWAAEAGGKRLVGSTIEGDFPDWRRLMPPIDISARFDRDAFASAMALADLNDDRTRAVKVTAETGLIRLEVRRGDGGSAEAEMEAEVAAPFAAGFNAKYIREALRLLPAGMLEGAFGNGSTPCLLRPAGGDGSRCAVVMPMRV